MKQAKRDKDLESDKRDKDSIKPSDRHKPSKIKPPRYDSRKIQLTKIDTDQDKKPDVDLAPSTYVKKKKKNIDNKKQKVDPKKVAEIYLRNKIIC